MDILTDLFILSVGGVMGFATAAIFASRAVSDANNKLTQASFAAHLIGFYANKLGVSDNKDIREALKMLRQAVGDNNA